MKNTFGRDPLTQSVHAARGDAPTPADVRRWQRTVAGLASIAVVPTTAAAMTSAGAAVGTSTAVAGASKATLGATGLFSGGGAAGGLVGGGAKIVGSVLVTFALAGGGAVAYQVSTDASAPPPNDGVLVESKIPATQVGTRSTPPSASPRSAAPQEIAVKNAASESTPTAAARPPVLPQRANEVKPAEPSSFVRGQAARGVSPEQSEQVPTAAFPLSEAAEEARVIEAARQALVSNPAQTLALVRRHEEQFPGGALGIERRVLFIEALYLLGRKAEATNAFEKFRQDHPASAHLRRLEQISSRL